jgi:hypothetical protein
MRFVDKSSQILLQCLCGTTSRAKISKEIGNLSTRVLNLSNKKATSSAEQRLLGQLAVVAFCSSKYKDLFSLPTFSRSMSIHIARLLQLQNRGNGGQNQVLFRVRMQTDKCWLGHLLEAVHADLILAIFLDVDKEGATKSMKRCQNSCLRLSLEDSASLKSYTGLNNKQYVRLNRMLFYLTGIRLLAPIKTIQSLKVISFRLDFKSITRRVVDMTRVTKNGKLHMSRKIWVDVTSVQPFECILNSVASLLVKGTLIP